MGVPNDLDRRKAAPLGGKRSGHAVFSSPPQESGERVSNRSMATAEASLSTTISSECEAKAGSGPIAFQPSVCRDGKFSTTYNRRRFRCSKNPMRVRRIVEREVVRELYQA